MIALLEVESAIAGVWSAMRAISTVTTIPTNWEACCSAWTQGNPDTGFRSWATSTTARQR